MAKKPQERSGRAELVGLVLAISIPAGIMALWASPRPARPAEMPPLVLPAAEVAREIAEQHAFAMHAIADDDENEHARREAYLAEGLAEVRMDDPPERASARTARLVWLVQQEAAAGDDAVAAIRARDVERMLPALRGTGDLTETERASELGAFPRMLERYGAVVDGYRVAPELVLRAMFHARWNSKHGLPLEDGMSRIARRAYYGWLALEGGEAPLGMRIEALDPYAAAGGTRIWEARAVLAFQSGEYAEARGDFERACDLTGSLRLRNHALAAVAAALGDGTSD